MRMKMIMINGPIGSGKTWILNQLKAEYKGHSVGIIPVSIKEPLVAGTMAMLGVSHEDYDTFKKTSYSGLTGREWILRFDKSARDIDENIFADAMLKKALIQFHPAVKQLFICDSVGIESELDRIRAHPNVDVLVASIDDGKTLPYTQYEGDSRYNLSPKAAIVQPNSTLLLAGIKAAIARRGWV